MSNTDDRIAALEKRVDGLATEVRRLTDALMRRNGDIPSEPIYPIDPTDLPGPAYAANLCPTCGIALGRVMGYACPHATCPTGLGSTVCMGGR